MSDETALVVLLIAICTFWIAKYFWLGNYKEDVFVGTGTWLVGRDIPPGKADLVAETGGGDFCLREKRSKDWSLGNKIGVTSGLQPSSFRNIYLRQGDILEVNGNVTIMITPPSRIWDATAQPLGPGNYRFGVDIPEGKYDLKAISGDGEVYLAVVGKSDYTFFQDMSAGSTFKASEYANLTCTKGHEMWIQGSLQIQLSRSEHQPLFLRDII